MKGDYRLTGAFSEAALVGAAVLDLSGNCNIMLADFRCAGSGIRERISIIAVIRNPNAFNFIIPGNDAQKTTRNPIVPHLSPGRSEEPSVRHRTAFQLLEWNGAGGSCRTEQDLAKYTVGNRRPISSHLMNSQLATVAKFNSSVPVPNFDTRVETKQPAAA